MAQRGPRLIDGAGCIGARRIGARRTGAERVGTRYAVALNSCTAALHIALQLVDVGPGDEVLVPTMTFVSTAMRSSGMSRKKRSATTWR